MRLRSTFTLLFLAIAMVAGVIFVEHPIREAKNRIPDKSLFNWNPEDITTIRLRIHNQPEISLEKSNGQWQITKPSAYPADRELAHSFVTQMLSLKWEARILPTEFSSRANANAQFGLDSPIASVLLGSSNRTLQMLVGSPTAFGDQCFLKVVGQGPVYIVDAEIFRSYPAQAAAWRERRLLTELPVHDAIRIRIADTTFELQKNNTNKQWRFTRPFEGRVNLFALTNAIEALTQQTVLQFVDVPESRLPQFGIDPEKPVGEITLLQGTNEQFQIVFGGSPTNFTTNIFSKITGRSGLIVLPNAVLEPWASPKANLRDYRLMSMDPEAVTQAKFEGSSTFTIHKSGTNWVLENGGFKLDSLLASQIIYHLRNTTTEEERAVVTDLSAYGLDKPELQVKLSTREQGEIILSFAPTSTNKVFVHHSGEAALYSINTKQYSRLPHAPWQLRDRQVWSFSPPELQRIILEQGERKGSLVRNEKLGWSPGTNTQGSVNSFWLEEALAQVSNLRAVFWRDKGTENFAAFGLAPPLHKVRFEFSGGKKPLEVLFGNPSEYGHRFAATELDGEWHVFEMPVGIYEEYVAPNLTLDRLIKRF